MHDEDLARADTIEKGGSDVALGEREGPSALGRILLFEERLMWDSESAAGAGNTASGLVAATLVCSGVRVGLALIAKEVAASAGTFNGRQ